MSVLVLPDTFSKAITIACFRKPSVSSELPMDTRDASIVLPITIHILYPI